jgi:hypothetical protein
MPNTERLLSLLAWAEGEHEKSERGEPSEWDQGSWITRQRSVPCGTACCIAGKVALDDGLEPRISGRSWEAVHDFDSTSTVLLDGERLSVPEYAQVALGLDRYQANELFAGGNTIEDLRRIIGGLVES